jgi:hypothetical protein
LIWQLRPPLPQPAASKTLLPDLIAFGAIVDQGLLSLCAPLARQLSAKLCRYRSG